MVQSGDIGVLKAFLEWYQSRLYRGYVPICTEKLRYWFGISNQWQYIINSIEWYIIF